MKKEVVVIGQGYVGLSSVINLVDDGYQVIGFDIDKKKIDLLTQGISYLDTVSDELIKTLINQGVLFTRDEQAIKDKDVYIIDVPTPINDQKIPDLSYIQSAVNLIKDKVKQGSLVILESTTYPGTTETYVVEEFKKLGYKIGTNLFIGYSPERIDPGNTKFSQTEIPRIVSGYSDNCLKKVNEFFGKRVLPVANLKTAELAKIYENTFRLVNIALADELEKIADNLNIKTEDVIDAAATKPFGFMKFTPSLGIGGHCIPVDPYYLTWLMEKRGVETPLISTAGQINDSMLDYYFEKISQVLKKIGKPFSELKIAVLGITYKKNVADLRMSSVVKLISKLESEQIKVVPYDDVINSLPNLTGKKVESLAGNYGKLNEYDLVICAVDHDIYKNNKVIIKQNSQLCFDLTEV